MRVSLVAPARRLMAVLAVLAGLVAVTMVSPGGSPAGATGAERLLRMRATISTLANGVLLTAPTGARIVNGAAVSLSGATLQWGNDGVLVARAEGATEVHAVVELLVAGHPETGTVTWGRTVASNGRAGTALENINDRARPLRLARLVDESRLTSFAVDGAQAALRGPVQVEPAAHDRLVLAHWVPRHRSGDYSRFSNAPLYPQASTEDAAYVGHAIDQARSAGVGGFTVTWQPYLDKAVDVYMAEAAKRPGWHTALQLNTRLANTARSSAVASDPEVMAADIVHVLGRHPGAALVRTADGRPVVFAYQAARLSPAQWRQVLQTTAAAGHPVAVMGGNVSPEHLDVLDGYFVYNSLQFGDLGGAYRTAGELTRTHHLVRAGAARKTWIATVTPGMHDWDNERIIDRQDGARYRDQWTAARGSQADWVYIVSWNEYGEDTVIEPSVRWGSTYLDLTRELTGG